MKKMLNGLLLFTVFAIVLAGCGSVGDSSKSEATSGSEQTSKAAGPVTVKDDHGEVKLDKPAERIVVLEWTFTEDLIALGVQPVGNADNDDYKLWVTQEAKLADSVTDIGTRGEPNLEAIAALKPDLIISNADNNAAIYAQLKGIAPTIEYDPYKGNGYDYDRMVEIFKQIAIATGKTEQADKVLSELDQHYIEAKATLEKAGKANSHYALTQAFTAQNAASLRMFKDNSLVVGTLAKLGMVNDWKSDKTEKYGFSTVGIEALPAVQDSHFIYITQKTDDVFGAAMKNNSVWKELNFVKEKRIYPLDGTTWTFGGPISSKVLVDQVVGVLTK
ncbi:Fe3+-citrate ABC transporter substrate-binding protein [Paenibacillus sp. IHB B 3084]|uniref:ABC transporter substrate-binding protein n=1 Tax=Paenibacillus sp. IHB B 3084 TaxID=867076 RepID=UPI000720A347|nr:iron-siderophore ABC transporter substrate-binding protein [Paenibacillus sp. IHB B 3084]ALP35363.1 Fe3+-citrate ABC transporter substrate-binding protein [Paenibacillus sp. IHB B 3084]